MSTLQHRTLFPMLLLAAASLPAPGHGSEAPPAALPASCGGCHALDKPMLGPSYRAIAARYAGEGDAASRLMASLRAGSSGTWGEVPMRPVPEAQLSDEDLAAVVRWILDLD